MALPELSGRKNALLRLLSTVLAAGAAAPQAARLLLIAYGQRTLLRVETAQRVLQRATVSLVKEIVRQNAARTLALIRATTTHVPGMLVGMSLIAEPRGSASFHRAALARV